MQTFATGSPNGATLRAPTRRASSGFDLSTLFGGLQDVASSVLPFVQEANRNDESLRALRAQQSVALAQQGFTTGAATVDPTFAQLAAFGARPVSGGGAASPQVSALLGRLSAYLPLALGGLLLMKLVK